MVFINEADFIGLLIIGLNNITGSLFLSLLFIMVLLLAISLGFGIPSTIVSIIYLPLVLTVAAYTGDYLAVGGIILIYLGIVLGENLFK